MTRQMLRQMASACLLHARAISLTAHRIAAALACGASIAVDLIGDASALAVVACAGLALGACASLIVHELISHASSLTLSASGHAETAQDSEADHIAHGALTHCPACDEGQRTTGEVTP